MRKIVDYDKLPKEKKTETIMLRLSVSVKKRLQEKAMMQRRRPGEMARVLVEEGLDRMVVR